VLRPDEFVKVIVPFPSLLPAVTVHVPCGTELPPGLPATRKPELTMEHGTPAEAECVTVIVGPGTFTIWVAVLVVAGRALLTVTTRVVGRCTAYPPAAAPASSNTPAAPPLAPATVLFVPSLPLLRLASHIKAQGELVA
jgi:hypothetical protein